VGLVSSGIERRDFFRDPVRVIDPEDLTGFEKLLSIMSETAYQGRKLGEVFGVIVKMIRDPDVTIYMGLAGSMATAGMWGVVSWIIERRYIDVLVSTGANVSEDIYAGMGFPYGRGSPCVDDSLLLKYRIDRFYDVYADEYLYREMERLLKDFIKDLPKNHVYSSAEFLYLLGARLNRLGIRSIATSAYKARVPIFVPAIVDSGYGIASILALKEYGGRVIIDQFKDFEQMVEIAMRSRETGVIYIGGGVPTDTTQLVAVAKALLEERERGSDVSKPHKYAVKITTDLPQWGGLSGATLEEAVSWGKVDALNSAMVNVDATIALPIISAALRELGVRRPGVDLSWVFREVAGYEDKV
jgi:deoxyhypusine synthase